MQGPELGCLGDTRVDMYGVVGVNGGPPVLKNHSTHALNSLAS